MNRLVTKLICCTFLPFGSVLLAVPVPYRRVEAVAVVPYAGRAESVSTRTSEGCARETGASTAPDIVKVKGVGTGETEEAALKDAYRDAVESAVGMYVDAEQAAKNDEIIKDEILTHSNAYIEDYDEIEKKKENGLVKIKILVRVKRQEITKRISGTMKAKSFKVGGGLKNLHAQMTTTEKKSGDGAALLANALEGVDPLRQLMEVSLATGEAVQIEAKDHRLTKYGRKGAAGEGEVELAYLFKFEINRDRYFKEFLPNLDRVLTQVSDREPQEIVINARMFQMQQRDVQRKQEYLNPNGNFFGKLNRGILAGEKTFSSAAFGEVRGQACRSVGDHGPLDVVVVTEANESMSAIRGKTFSLDEAAACVIDDLRDGSSAEAARRAAIRTRGAASRRAIRNATLPSYNVLFLDEQGKTLAAHQIGIAFQGSNVKDFISCENIVSAYSGRGESQMRNNRFWFVTPFIGCHGSAYYQWCSFKIAKDDLPKIDSIKIELAK